jgi:hypothetical protein
MDADDDWWLRLLLLSQSFFGSACGLTSTLFSAGRFKTFGSGSGLSDGGLPSATVGFGFGLLVWFVPWEAGALEGTISISESESILLYSSDKTNEKQSVPCMHLRYWEGK